MRASLPDVLTPKREKKVKISSWGSCTKEAEVRKSSLEILGGRLAALDTCGTRSGVGRGARQGAARLMVVRTVIPDCVILSNSLDLSEPQASHL